MHVVLMYECRWAGDGEFELTRTTKKLAKHLIAGTFFSLHCL